MELLLKKASVEYFHINRSSCFSSYTLCVCVSIECGGTDVRVNWMQGRKRVGGRKERDETRRKRKRMRCMQVENALFTSERKRKHYHTLWPAVFSSHLPRYESMMSHADQFNSQLARTHSPPPINHQHGHIFCTCIAPDMCTIVHHTLHHTHTFTRSLARSLTVLHDVHCTPYTYLPRHSRAQDTPSLEI